MKQAKIISSVFGVAAIVLLCTMCAYVAYLYRSYVCAMYHIGTSAPPWVAFLFAIPFLIAIGICFLLHLIFKKKAQ